MPKKQNIDELKSKVAALVGKKVCVRLNRGRNRIKHFDGVLTEMHSNVFVISVQNQATDRISCSYFEMMCGEIQLKEAPTK